MNRRDWALLLVLSVLWGGSFFFVGVAVRELPALTIAAARVGIAAATLLGVLAIARPRGPPAITLWPALLVMGLLNNAVPFALFAWGQHHIASGLAAILNATTPLFTVLVAHRFTADERLSVRKGAGILLGFGGVAVMLGGVRGGIDGGSLAPAACLAAALSYACAGVYGRRFARQGVPPLPVAAGQLAAAALILLPLAALVERPWTLSFPGASTVAALLAIGLMSTALAYLIYFRLLASAGATNLLLVTFLIPVSAILLGVGALGERLELRHLAGMTLIGAGLALIDGRLLSRRKRPPLLDSAAQ